MFSQIFGSPYFLGGAALVALFVLWILIAMMFRVVVPTNEVHIVQSKSRTVSFGKDQAAGNSYYRWPSWIPRIGIRVSTLPMTVFGIQLHDYAAYDKGRLPLMLDMMAFFRITDSDQAAQRISTFAELKGQLEGIMQGAARSILATNEIEHILEGRGQFGEQFTKEVDGNLREWGVQTVKQIELMDIRDAQGSKVIQNIMAKRSSEIDRESRVQVAHNRQAAEVAEAAAAEVIGQRNAEKDKNIGIANEQSKQAIQVEAKTTKDREMDVRRVEQVRQAEITRDAKVVEAEQDRQTTVITAEGEKDRLRITAEGTLSEAQLRAQGIEAEGRAQGAADLAKLLAPVDSQIKLADSIGNNKEYQEYLLKIKQIEANQVVGVEQAKAVQQANIKVVATGSDAVSGIRNAANLVSPAGGANMGAMLEAFLATDAGKALAAKLGGFMSGFGGVKKTPNSDVDDDA